MNNKETRLMLDKIKNFSRVSKFGNLNEQEQYQQPQVQDTTSDPTSTQPQQDDLTVINDVDVKFLSNDKADMVLTDDQKNKISELIDGFRTNVSQTASMEPGFTFTPGQIRLDGELTDEGLKFVFIAGNEGGAYINAEMLKLEQNMANILEKLVKYQETFESSCNPIINDRGTN